MYFIIHYSLFITNILANGHIISLPILIHREIPALIKYILNIIKASPCTDIKNINHTDNISSTTSDVYNTEVHK